MIYTTPAAGDVRLDWDGGEMTVWTINSLCEEIGSFTCHVFEDADGTEYAHITNMYLDGSNGSGRFQRQGIGRAILQHLLADEGLMPLFSPHDGNRREDGSHLTGDGPGFASAMVREGLADWR